MAISPFLIHPKLAPFITIRCVSSFMLMPTYQPSSSSAYGTKLHRQIGNPLAIPPNPTFKVRNS